MSKESISIQNFGGLQNVKIDIKPMTLLIGPQAAGKSIIAKLLYYFKSFFQVLFDWQTKEFLMPELDQDFHEYYVRVFIQYFPEDTWNIKGFEIIYTIGNESIKIKKHKEGALKLHWSEGIHRIFDTDKWEMPPDVLFYKLKNDLEGYYQFLKADLGIQADFEQLFIPAGRSFFANIQSNIFSLLRRDINIDPFLIEFGAVYEKFKQNFDKLLPKIQNNQDLDSLLRGILKGNYLREWGEDYLVHEDQRKVKLIHASSGQQETLPLLIILMQLLLKEQSAEGHTLYIEEPEAHLFPTAQKKVFELMAILFGYTGKRVQFFITTHSPYSLAVLNNLMEAGLIQSNVKDEETLNALNTIIPQSRHIHPDFVAAYALENGKAIDLIDQESNLILADLLDAVSEDIAIEFGNLLDLEV